MCQLSFEKFKSCGHDIVYRLKCCDQHSAKMCINLYPSICFELNRVYKDHDGEEISCGRCNGRSHIEVILIPGEVTYYTSLRDFEVVYKDEFGIEQYFAFWTSEDDDAVDQVTWMGPHSTAAQEADRVDEDTIQVSTWRWTQEKAEWIAARIEEYAQQTNGLSITFEHLASDIHKQFGSSKNPDAVEEYIMSHPVLRAKKEYHLQRASQSTSAA